MSGLDVAALQPTVSQVAIRLHRRYPAVDRADAEQECWVWALEHPRKAAEWLALDASESEPLLYRAMWNHAQRACIRQVGEAGGARMKDTAWYTRAQIEELLEHVFDYEAWVEPGSPETGARLSDPATGGNWQATLADVSRAVSQLDREEQELLEAYYNSPATQRDLAKRYGCDHRTIGRRLDRAVAHIHEALGGDRPKEDPPERRRVPSNAQAKALIDSYW